MLPLPGSILSGDQSARISLARAAYSDADIYLIDDIFAEMEPRSVRSVFEKCVCEVLGDRIRVLVSRQVNRRNNVHLRLLFSLNSKEMAKMRLLAIWIDQR